MLRRAAVVKSQRVGGTYRLHLHGDKNRRARNNSLLRLLVIAKREELLSALFSLRSVSHQGKYAISSSQNFS
jgi:hypothetical protein